MIRSFTPVFAVAALVIGAPVSAQHYHGGYNSGHYDVIPGHYHQHGDHYDYHPPQTVYHHGDHHHPVYPSYPQSTTFPGTTYYPSQPSYPQTMDATPYVVQRPVNPGSIGHVDDVAVDLERAANQMCLEMYYNYRQNRGWDETYREAYEILSTAKQIHAMEHSGDREQMRQAATRIDGLFHHVQDDVRHWARYGGQYFGPGGLRARMDEVEDELHHLMQDIGAAAPEDVAQPAPQAVSPAPPSNGFAPAAFSVAPFSQSQQ